MVDTSGVAYIFPGQGAQAVGMGHALYQHSAAARKVLDEADRALGFSISRLCFEGPAEELVKTVNVQPAVLAISLACLAAAGEASGGRLKPPSFVAGHSLGEYTALVASGTLTLPDAIRLVRERGRLMQAAGEANPGSMLAVLGFDPLKLEAVCVESGCEPANLNCPGQVVISGSLEAIEKARGLFKTAGARTLPLKVSGAFHSGLMAPALAGLKTALASVPFRTPAMPLVSNVTAEPVTDPFALPVELLAQLTSRVRWQQSLEAMSARSVTVFLEFGPGEVLAGLVRRTLPEARAFSLNNPESIAAALAAPGVCA
jgi:[acyl-carrier-protein] S-malonyltransferase